MNKDAWLTSHFLVFTPFTELCGVMLVTHLAVFSIFDILLSVEEPVWDFVLARILHDGHHTLDLETEGHSSPNVPWTLTRG